MGGQPRTRPSSRVSVSSFAVQTGHGEPRTMPRAGLTALCDVFLSPEGAIDAPIRDAANHKGRLRLTSQPQAIV